MRKLISSLAAAGLLALLPTAADAQNYRSQGARPYYPTRPPVVQNYYPRQPAYPRQNWVAPFVGGMALGAIAGGAYAYQPAYPVAPPVAPPVYGYVPPPVYGYVPTPPPVIVEQPGPVWPEEDVGGPCYTNKSGITVCR